MSKTDENPLEGLVQEIADYMPRMIDELLDVVAPFHPWWHTELTNEEQLARYLDGFRAGVVPWLLAAGRYLGAQSSREALSMLERIFTDPALPALLPLDFQANRPLALVEAVQAAGPDEMARHIRKMEAMIEGYEAGRRQASPLIETMLEGPGEERV